MRLLAWSGGLPFLRRRVCEEPGLLLFDKTRYLLADVANGLQSKFAREIVDRVVGRLFEVGGPTLGRLQKFGQSFANIAVAWAVVVEVIVELVRDRGELVKKIVRVLFASRFAGMSVELLDRFITGVEEFDEDENAIVRNIGSFTKLLNLAFGERGVGALGTEGQSNNQKEKSKREPTVH
jgi:hypothetical protein